MKKLLLTTAIVMSFGTTAAFAHHPAEDMVDPVTYEMIDGNTSDAHDALTFDDMGSDVMAGDTDVGGDSSVGGTAVSRDLDGDMGDFSAEIGENMDDIGAEMEAREEMNATADAADPSGDMTRKR